MPWNRLRTAPSDNRRRQSALHLKPEEDPGHEPDGTADSRREPDSLPAASPSLSTCMDQGNALHTSVSHGHVPPPNGQDSPQIKSQRFSLLKFRHASDSQLSRTAREQAMMPTQPMPTGKSSPPQESDNPKQRSSLLPRSSSYHHNRPSRRHT